MAVAMTWKVIGIALGKTHEGGILDEDAIERDLFMNKLLTDHQNGFQLVEELFDEPSSIRRNSQYDNLKWRNDKLSVLHLLHIKYLKIWRSLDDEDLLEKSKLFKDFETPAAVGLEGVAASFAANK